MNVVFRVLAVAMLALCGCSAKQLDDEQFKIAAFNIQVFGTSKASKPDVMNVLVDIIQRYDIVLIQEIRDASGNAIRTLREQVNERGPHQYDSTISARLGDTNSKEQYAFFYRDNTGIEEVRVHQYIDPEDVYERPPYSVHFRSANTVISDFVLMGVHIKPDNAVAEIDHLGVVHQEIKQLWNTEDILIMGDMNADCGYVNNAEKANLVLRTDAAYHWWIDDDADSTVASSRSSNCAYDRFIMTGSEFIDAVVPGSASVFLFDAAYNLNATFAKSVSDHYPIELELRTISDTDTSGTVGYHGDTHALACFFVHVMMKMAAILK